MPKYAVILNNLVENVILADSLPQIPGRTVVQLTANQPVGSGDSYDGTTFIPYQPSAAEILRRDAPTRLRTLYPIARQWSQDAAQTNTNWSGMNAAQKDAAMRETIRRLGLFFDGMADLLLERGLDS